MKLNKMYIRSIIRVPSSNRLIYMKVTPMDLELMITLYEQCSPPFAKDVVLTSEVGDYLRSHYDYIHSSNDRIGRYLSRPPFNGTRKIWYTADGKQCRGYVLRDHQWITAPSKDVMSYIAGDPLLM